MTNKRKRVKLSWEKKSWEKKRLILGGVFGREVCQICGEFKNFSGGLSAMLLHGRFGYICQDCRTRQRKQYPGLDPFDSKYSPQDYERGRRLFLKEIYGRGYWYCPCCGQKWSLGIVAKLYERIHQPWHGYDAKDLVCPECRAKFHPKDWSHFLCRLSWRRRQSQYDKNPLLALEAKREVKAWWDRILREGKKIEKRKQAEKSCGG